MSAEPARNTRTRSEGPSAANGGEQPQPDPLQVRQALVTAAELKSLKPGRAVYARSGGVFLLSSRDEQLARATDELAKLQEAPSKQQ
ncbi:hypothetical protein CHLRE_11g480079v5 [Chlamydomonas reinhardtii]|uniref:Uncharacterized protein n=1 Tax=Chlamydomonas reinhardtii TaxID=3055 RepID=A0A2K3D8M3_CHLRE|nr:uncharacterized protein CHLRE_11g480079v5 [Chlamydomonas reinhardtii]PNW76884.1 hypothetical protein CHLRE_11g480079v5 [Chlamydomonas reinhardtii]